MRKSWFDILPLALFVFGCISLATKGGHTFWSATSIVFALAAVMLTSLYVSARCNRFWGWLFCILSFMLIMWLSDSSQNW